MNAEDFIAQWPTGSVVFLLTRYEDGGWAAQLHTYGGGPTTGFTGDSADAVLSALRNHLTPAPPATDFDDLI